MSGRSTWRRAGPRVQGASGGALALGLPPDDRRYYPLYAECCELDITFCTQVGHAGPLRASEPGRPIPYLDHVALEFPELRIVGGHVGVPWLTEVISLCTKYPNVFVDTSAYTVARYPAELVAYLKGHGRSKVLFGSNHPFWPAPDCLAGLELDDGTRRLFLADNARRAVRLDARQPGRTVRFSTVRPRFADDNPYPRWCPTSEVKINWPSSNRSPPWRQRFSPVP